MKQTPGQGTDQNPQHAARGAALRELAPPGELLEEERAAAGEPHQIRISAETGDQRQERGGHVQAADPKQQGGRDSPPAQGLEAETALETLLLVAGE